MAENILVRPACYIEPRACRKEIVARVREFKAAFPRKTLDQDVAETVEIAHVRSGIFALCI